MKTALVTASESGDNYVPSSTLDEIRAMGMELVCKKCVTEEDVLETAKDAEIIWFFGQCPGLTPAVMDKLPKLKAIFRSGSGVDAIHPHATDLGIAICNTPESISEAVAEQAVSLLFALSKHIQFHSRVIREGEWLPKGLLYSFHLTGRTLGLVGYGRIARRVEEMVAGFHMHVIHSDPYAPNSVPLEQLLKESDYISLHCPLTEETRHSINEKAFSLMKKTALLVNTSRGQVVDEKALIAALQEGKIAGAALDVMEQEPLEKDSPLRKMDNVILTPHIAAFTTDFSKNFWAYSVKKLAALMKGDFKKESVNLR
ncbi:MAG: C-terminal binding protein [Lentisphaeria bacterium]|nr:C-terminal binding protein [Lentisphaeria bacterium]